MNYSLKEIASSYIDATKGALNGALNLDQVRNCWRMEADREKLLWKLLSETEHFLTDRDIRMKDASYERYQRELLESLIVDVIHEYGVELPPRKNSP